MRFSRTCSGMWISGSTVEIGLQWLLPLKTTPQQWQRCYVSYYILVVVLEENTTQRPCMFIILGKVTTGIKSSFNLQFIIILDCGQLALSHISHCPLAFLPVHCQRQTMARPDPQHQTYHTISYESSLNVWVLSIEQDLWTFFCMPSPSNTYPGVGQLAQWLSRHPTWQLTTITNSTFRGNDLFWTQWAPCIDIVHKYLHRQNIH